MIVDPKGKDFSIYRGATLITPNRKELAEATRRTASARDAELAAAATTLRGDGSEAVLVTRSEEGMTLVAAPRAPVHVPAYAVKVRDVRARATPWSRSLAAMLALGADFEVGHARGQRGGCGRGRQTRHRHGFGRRAQRAHPAGGDARGRGEDRVRLVGAR